MYQLHSGSDSSHLILAKLARQCSRSPVLDVGAAEGFLGQLLVGSGLDIDALEPNEQYAAVARPYYRKVHCAAAEQANLENVYGTMVFGDVLEHLVDPAAVLSRLMAHLSPEGIVLVSLPNIAHVAIRLMLLGGKLPVMDRGPLDRTHLHFYTRSTAEQLMNDAGLRVIEWHASLVPLRDLAVGQLVRAARVADVFQRVAVRLAPSLFAYQWILVARQEK